MMRIARFFLTLSVGLLSAYPGPYPPGGSCNINGGPPDSICIGAPFGDNAVLQRAPARAAITGSVPRGYGTAPMTVTTAFVDEESDWQISVSTTVRDDNTWKVLLPPRPTGGNYSFQASCTAGCVGTNRSAAARLVNLTMGDVYICSGQSNMQLMMEYTFERNTSVAAIRKGNYDNIRIFHGPMNFDYATNRTDIWVIAGQQGGDRTDLTVGAWRYPRDTVDLIPNGWNTPPFYLTTNFGRMYATCWYTFEALTDALIAAGKQPPPFGLIAVAVGGTKIAQWVEWTAQAGCTNVTCCDTEDCTQSPTSNPAPYQPITHVNCTGNAQLYNGLIAPLVNCTVAGWLFYQGENSLCYDAGSSQQSKGYGCMMPTLISSWRKVWSVEPGTTDPLAPFGFVSLADGTDEGYGINMRQFRWAQTANYGRVPNAAMPRCFIAEAYDLGDPWHTPICGNSGIFEGGPFIGTQCCVGANDEQPKGPLCVGDHRGEYALNATRDWAQLGPLHPRVKKAVGMRLAQSLHAVAYNGTAIAAGPVFDGCDIAADGLTLTLRFDKKLLKGERVLFDATNTIEKEDTALYVLLNDTVDTTSLAFVRNMEANHQPNHNYFGPYRDGNEMGVRGWVPVAASVGPTLDTLTVDLGGLPTGSKVAAVRYAVGSGGYNSSTGERLDRRLGSSRICCGPHVDTALQPCKPENCPIKASGPGSLPASPFFAAIDWKRRRCQCFSPQECS